jgi:hypothetical protein
MHHLELQYQQFIAWLNANKIKIPVHGYSRPKYEPAGHLRI